MQDLSDRHHRTGGVGGVGELQPPPPFLLISTNFLTLILQPLAQDRQPTKEHENVII